MAERVDFASRAAAAILLRAMGPPSAFARRLGWDDARLVDEVTAMVTAYRVRALSALNGRIAPNHG